MYRREQVHLLEKIDPFPYGALGNCIIKQTHLLEPAGSKLPIGNPAAR